MFEINIKCCPNVIKMLIYGQNKRQEFSWQYLDFFFIEFLTI